MDKELIRKYELDGESIDFDLINDDENDAMHNYLNKIAARLRDTFNEAALLCQVKEPGENEFPFKVIFFGKVSIAGAAELRYGMPVFEDGLHFLLVTQEGYFKGGTIVKNVSEIDRAQAFIKKMIEEAPISDEEKEDLLYKLKNGIHPDGSIESPTEPGKVREVNLNSNPLHDIGDYLEDLEKED